MESREKRIVERPRVPRTAKKLNTKRMGKEMGELGLDIVEESMVSTLWLLHYSSYTCITKNKVPGNPHITMALPLVQQMMFVICQTGFMMTKLYEQYNDIISSHSNFLLKTCTGRAPNNFVTGKGISDFYWD